jgi:carbon starvation protein
MLWILIGGIFFGGVHDFGALFASIRHKGASIGEVISDAIGARAKKLFIIFAYLTLILVVAAFASIVANTFKATYTEAGALDLAASAANASTATISILFILMAIIFGFFVYRRNAPLSVATIIGIVGIIACMAIGLNWHPLYLSGNVWMVIVGVYIAVASVTPVWILLQPRDYLSSFLLYGMMILALVGIIGCHPTVDMPAFTGFVDTLAPTGSSLGYLFPALFVTIACGAVSGFHSLVGSGTTAKQLNRERDARPIAYGGMLIECALALISVCAVGYIWSQYADGTTVTPTVVFATGLASMFSSIFGEATYSVVYSMLILAVSAFCLTSVDTATRLARYMFQEFFTPSGKSREDLTGWRKTLTNPYVATIITVVLGVALGMTGYAKIWALFGAANQLLAALGLLAVCCWLGKIGRNNKMFYIPMFFMLVVTLTSLVFTIRTQFAGIAAGGEGVAWFWVRGIIAILLVILAIVLVVEGVRALSNQRKAKTA